MSSLKQWKVFTQKKGKQMYLGCLYASDHLSSEEVYHSTITEHGYPSYVWVESGSDSFNKPGVEK